MNGDGAGVKTILFVSCGAELYGAERSLLEIVNVMSETWRPVFVVPSKGRNSDALQCAKYDVEIADVPHEPEDGVVRFLLAILRLAWIIRKRRVGLVHANLQSAVPLVAASCRLAGVPFVAHLRNMVPDALDERRTKPFHLASAIICISQAVHASACAAGMISPQQQERIWIIPDGRQLSTYRDNDGAGIRAELGIGEDVPLIGMVARIEPMKGQHIFLEAAALVAQQVPRAHFLLVGDAAHEGHRGYLAELKGRCRNSGGDLHVTFLGYRADIPNILAALDCFVYPSSRGAFVSVLIEAMATGVPLVVSAVDGIPECVGRDGAAELIDNLEPANFANAILQIVRDPAKQASMSQAGRERATRYDAICLARETESVFEGSYPVHRQGVPHNHDPIPSGKLWSALAMGYDVSWKTVFWRKAVKLYKVSDRLSGGRLHKAYGRLTER